MRIVTYILLSSLSLTTLAATADPLPTDVQTFETERSQRVQSLTQTYLDKARLALEQSWTPPAHTGLLVTKFAITLDNSGRLLSKRNIVPSASPDEDGSAEKTLESVEFPVLPSQLQCLDLYPAFMSDGSANIVKLSLLPPESPNTDQVPPVAPSLRRAVSAPLATEAGIDLTSYMEELQLKLKKCWFPPRHRDNKRVVVRFGINQAGALSHLRLDHSSGVTAADQAALKAVENAAPFKPLPSGVPGDLDAQFVFGRGLLGSDIRGSLLSH